MRFSVRERKEFLLLFFLLVVLPIGFYLLGGFTKASISSFESEGELTTYEVVNSWTADWFSSISWIENNPFWDPLVANNIFVIVSMYAISFSAVILLIVKRKKVGAWISG